MPTLFTVPLAVPVVPVQQAKAMPSLRASRHFQAIPVKNAPPLTDRLEPPNGDRFVLEVCTQPEPVRLQAPMARRQLDEALEQLKKMDIHKTESAKSIDAKRLLLAGNEVLRQWRQLRAEHEPHGRTVSLVVTNAKHSGSAHVLKKLPAPFHSDGMPLDFIRLFLTGQLNGASISRYASNRVAIALQNNQARLHPENLRYTGAAKQAEAVAFSRLEMEKLRETAVEYAYNTSDTAQMTDYLEQLTQIVSQAPESFVKTATKSSKKELAFMIQSPHGKSRLQSLRLPSFEALS